MGRYEFGNDGSRPPLGSTTILATFQGRCRPPMPSMTSLIQYEEYQMHYEVPNEDTK